MPCEFDKLPEDDEYKFNKIKNKIMQEFSRKEIHDPQYNEVYSMLPGMSSSQSQNIAPSRLRCRKCSRIGHIARKCKSRQQKSSSSYIAELCSQDCYANEVLLPCWE